MSDGEIYPGRNRWCNTCKWWRVEAWPTSLSPANQPGRCYRFPPPARFDGTWFFPIVHGGDFCGEYADSEEERKNP